MDVGGILLTKIVDEKALKLARSAGITKDFFDEPYIPVFRYVENHYTDYKVVPGRDAVQKAFPNFDFIEAEEPVDFYVNLSKENYRRVLIEERLEEAATVYNFDTHKAEAILRTALADLRITQKSHKDVDIAESALEFVAAYEERKKNPGANGVLSGWSKMDYQTLGWQKEQFICLVGEKYMGKSWIMLWLAYKAVLQGERVLFVTKEMSQEALINRLHSIYANVEFDSLRRGELTNVEEHRYREKMDQLHQSNAKFVVARAGIQTVQDIETKAVEMDATIIFGDSIYLFPHEESARYSNETQKRAQISQKCKEVATNLGIPFVVSVQAGRKKTKERVPSLDDIEYTNSFSQDGDVIFFLEKSPLDKELNRAQMYLLKSRDGDLAQFYIKTDWNYMKFEQSDEQMEPTTNVFSESEKGIFDD